MAPASNRKSNPKLKAVRAVPPKALALLYRDARVEMGLDFAALAKEASVSLARVRMLESEPQQVPLQDLYAVANVLNLDPGDVLELLHTAMR